MSTMSKGKKIDGLLGGQLRIEQNDNRIMLTKNGVDQFILGVDDSGNIIMKLSKDGIDVKVATDAELILNSADDIFKIVHEDSVTISPSDFGSSGNAYLTKLATKLINLTPYNVDNPIVLCFLEDAAGNLVPLPFYDFNLDTGALIYQAKATVSTSTNYLSIEVRSTTTLSPGVPFRYYVLQQTASTSFIS